MDRIRIGIVIGKYSSDWHDVISSPEVDALLDFSPTPTHS